MASSGTGSYTRRCCEDWNGKYSYSKGYASQPSSVSQKRSSSEACQMGQWIATDSDCNKGRAAMHGAFGLPLDASSKTKGRLDTGCLGHRHSPAKRQGGEQSHHMVGMVIHLPLQSLTASLVFVRYCQYVLPHSRLPLADGAKVDMP